MGKMVTDIVNSIDSLAFKKNIIEPNLFKVYSSIIIIYSEYIHFTFKMM
jgi:hypothetical protein